MNKLEPNMYVRTNKGIFQIRNKNIFTEDKKQYIGVNGRYTCIDIETIEKVSHNIIDLIEKGDILEINNEKYEVIYDESYEKLGILIPSKKELSIRHSSLEYVFKKYKVSIVTKEQFSTMEYRLGDKDE